MENQLDDLISYPSIWGVKWLIDYVKGVVNLLISKLYNFHSLQVVDRFSDPQLEVSENNKI